MRLSDSSSVFGLVLAGGHSRRMKFDKASIDYRGEPEVRRMFALLADLCESAYVSVRSEQAHQKLYEDLPQVLDEGPSAGPIAGILSAMRSSPAAAWFVVGCDMPLLDRSELQRLLDARNSEADVTAYQATDGGIEPLCAIYEPDCRGALSDAFAGGVLSLRKILRDWDVRLVVPAADVTASANTPEESGTILRRLGQSESARCN